jgi:hypothetical protein
MSREEIRLSLKMLKTKVHNKLENTEYTENINIVKQDVNLSENTVFENCTGSKL